MDISVQHMHMVQQPDSCHADTVVYMGLVSESVLQLCLSCRSAQMMCSDLS